MKVADLFQVIDRLDESQGSEMKKHAMALKREGDLKGYHHQMIKYYDVMISAEDRNLRSHGRFSMSGQFAEKSLEKFEKAKLKHRVELNALREDHSEFIEEDDLLIEGGGKVKKMLRGKKIPKSDSTTAYQRMYGDKK
jgi:hypothetical protein